MPRAFGGSVARLAALAFVLFAVPSFAQQRQPPQESPRERMARLQQMESDLLLLINGWRACVADPDCIGMQVYGPRLWSTPMVYRVTRAELMRQLRYYNLLAVLSLGESDFNSFHFIQRDLEQSLRFFQERSNEIKDQIDKIEIPRWEQSLALIRRQFAAADRQAREFDTRPTARPLVWEFVAAWDAPASQAPPWIRQASANGSAGGGEAQITYVHGNCTEMRTSDWIISGDLGQLTERSRLDVSMSYEIIPPGCNDGRFGSTGIQLGPRPAFMHERIRQLGPTLQFVDGVFGAGVESAGASSMDRSRLSATARATIQVLRRPRAYNEVAEFRILTSAPGYAVMVAYIFRAVPEP